MSSRRPRRPRTPASRAEPQRTQRAPRSRRLLIVLLALAGSSILLYPSAGNWFSDRAHAAEITGYTETVDSMPEGERAEMLERARHYNASLTQGRIDDPYGLAAAAAAAGPEQAAEADPEAEPDPAAGPALAAGADPSATDQAATDEAATDQAATDQAATDHAASTQPASSEGSLEYLDQLSLSPSGTMARLRIPDIGVTLPVYHGTSDDTLARGVGHLQGSALPVGGLGTNSILTGHSGIPEATLLTDLHDLDGGELVSVDVLGETLTYEVDSISTVLPTETDLLQPVPGADLLTLVTCTPVGVNSHRLLVQAHRVEDGATPSAVTVGGTAGPGFPWWAVILGAALAIGTWFVWQPVLRTGARRRARHILRSVPRSASGRRRAHPQPRTESSKVRRAPARPV